MLSTRYLKNPGIIFRALSELNGTNKCIGVILVEDFPLILPIGRGQFNVCLSRHPRTQLMKSTDEKMFPDDPLPDILPKCWCSKSAACEILHLPIVSPSQLQRCLVRTCTATNGRSLLTCNNLSKYIRATYKETNSSKAGNTE